MLARARANGAAAGVAVDWRLGDVTDVDLAGFDAIHARMVLQFVPDPAATLRAFAQALVPGGRLAASVPGALSPIYGNSWRRFVDPPPIGATYMLPWELEHLLVHGGWTVVDEWGSFGANLAGDENPFNPATVASLPKRLQQAAATTWMIVAERY
jgi:SAM-dependent methyltransferase